MAGLLFNYDIPWNPNRIERRMGRIHRYGQPKDCLIFNFVATNTVEGRVLQRLLEKLQEIRDALEDDAVFNVVGEVLPAAHVEKVLRDFYAGRLGEADLEDRLLRNVDTGHFQAICRNALEGLATRTLNLAMLIERRALAQERRVVPETIARFIRESAETVSLALKPVGALAHAFDPGRTPAAQQRYQTNSDWRLPALATRYPRFSTDRDTAETHGLEWVTPGHPLFEALRRHALDTAFLQKADEEIGRAASDQGPGAEGRLAQAEARHAELQARRERRRGDFGRQRALSLQAVERIASVLILPHPERSAPEVRRLQPNPETEAIAMRVAMEHERAQGRQVYDVHEKNLGYDLTSLDLASGQLRLIESKGLGGAAGSILLTPNERRVAEDRRDCYWLYVVTSRSSAPRLEVNALTEPMQVREPEPPYGRTES